MGIVLPMNYSEIEQEEMMYLDGGGYFLSKSRATSALATLGMSPHAYIAAAASITLATKLVRSVAKFGGVWGYVAGVVVGFAASQVIAFGAGLARGAINKGVTFSFNLNPFKNPLGVNYIVH